MSGMMVDRRDQVLMTRFSPVALRASTFFSRWSPTNGPFFRLRGTATSLPPGPAGAAAADDQLVGFLVVGPGPALRLAPRRHRVPATGGLALATTQRVVDRVHGHPTGLRANALPAAPAGLADLDQLGLRVADHPEGGSAVDGHPAHLGGRQPQGGE